MDKLFKNLLSENKVSSPKHIEHALSEKFKSPMNIDWFIKSGTYEAIFYQNNIEHIAEFDMLGKLIYYKINLPLSMAPKHIRENFVLKGEIMNIVEINEEDKRTYEVIIRNDQSKRMLYIANDQGLIIEQKEL